MIDPVLGETFFALASPITGQNKDRATSCIFSSLYVAASIADYERLTQVDPMFLLSPEEHPCLRFATGARNIVRGAAVTGMVRTIINGVNVGAVLGQQFAESLMDCFNVLLGEEAACDSGLVGDNENLYSLSVRFSDGRRCSRNEFHFVWTGEVINFGVDSSITIEKDSDPINNHVSIVLRDLCTD